VGAPGVPGSRTATQAGWPPAVGGRLGWAAGGWSTPVPSMRVPWFPADPAVRGQTVIGRVAREVWSSSARSMVVPVYEAVQTYFHSDSGLVAELLRRVGYVRLGQWYVAGLLLEAFDDELPAESVGDHLR
jgi:hypothetical protein